MASLQCTLETVTYNDGYACTAQLPAYDHRKTDTDLAVVLDVNNLPITAFRRQAVQQSTNLALPSLR